ncbi:DUF6497 family protein [Jannaschia rubra]|uniref:Uncharacterized protein n=1 Tax=Jannaschia rubra TaxID=282197 RepID=A0A0M6XS51_9RHOB|nr:DUF6497 family protein [Jannaschia rubra]CTQ33011.1 hypothetical protein JAN5088_01786 [Jannaschia rubra]SFG58782.1 hypothetical protein SAMN04488517_10743 [Jannaschia rubra]
MAGGALLSLTFAFSAVAQGAIPSGQAIILWEIVWERVEGGTTQAVLRFIAPGIARDTGSIDAAAAMADIDWLCATHAVPLALLPAARAETYVVTIMDRAVARGEADAEATQYFGIYAITDGKCSPEDF